MSDLVRIVLELHLFFDDEAKEIAWLITPNLNFGGIAPWTMISSGRAWKVLRFIESAREENARAGTFTIWYNPIDNFLHLANRGYEALEKAGYVYIGKLD